MRTTDDPLLGDVESRTGLSGTAEGPQALRVLGLWKEYGGQPVVRDVSFTLEHGRFLTLLGPSGSGKTSTLMMVAGFTVPTEGRISVGGRDITAAPPQRRNFGVVFQSYSLFPHMTVAKNVEFPLRMRKLPRSSRRRRVMEALEQVDLLAFAERKPRQLSGGQQQRVALARALVFEPDALLLDEPLGALDKMLRERLQIEIKELHRRTGVPVLFVTHDQEEALMMSDLVGIMRDGTIEQLDTPSRLYHHPVNTFVATFLGETNLLRCTVTGSDGPHVTVTYADGSRGKVRLPASGRRASQGERAMVSVRPEALRVVSAALDVENGLDGLVSDLTFLGAYSRLTVETAATSVTVKRWVADRPSVEPGERVRIGWAAEDAQFVEGGAEEPF